MEASEAASVTGGWHSVERKDGKLDLTIPRFSVDKSLGNIPEPLPAASHFAIFCGPPGSGKSSLSTALLTQDHPRIYRGRFENVFLFIPKTSFDSMVDSPFKDHPRVIHDLSVSTLTLLEDLLEQSSAEGHTSLVIIDDFAPSLKNTELQRMFLKMAANRRHLRLSVWMISQNYINIPLAVRKLVTTIFLFRPGNTREIESIRSELLSFSKKDFEECFQYVFGSAEPHQFMMIDVAGGKIYNRFDLMVKKI